VVRFQQFHKQELIITLFQFPPNLDEQIQIVNYLDKKLTNISELIADKKRLLELYEEEKIAIINQAVTKGLYSNIPMKDSGIEWLGEIPEHWEVKKLKYVIKINSGEGIKSESIKPEGNYPIYGGNGVVGYSEYFNSSTDDIIIGRVGAKCGNVRLVKGEKWISDNALVSHLISEDNLRFVVIQLQNMNLNNMANKNAQPLITGTMVKEKIGVFPSPNEQDAIVDFIESENARIFAKSEKTIKLIDLLTETIH
jgi:type I restriction enzyme S subunit